MAKSVFKDVLRWRLFGALLWQSIVVVVAQVIWSLFSPGCGGWLSAVAGKLLFHGLQLQAVLTTHMILGSSEPPPLHAPRLGLPSSSWRAAIVSRLLIRSGSIKDICTVLVLHGSYAATAVLTLMTYSCPAAGARWSTLFGCCVGLTCSCMYLFRSGPVLAFQNSRRLYFFRLKARLPYIAKSTLQLVGSSTAAALLVAFLAPSWRPTSIAELLGSVRAAMLCVLCLVCGQALLDIVYSHPCRLQTNEDPSSIEPLVAAIADSNPLVQDLALLDLALLAEDTSSYGPRRRSAFWSAHSGQQVWPGLAKAVLLELRSFTAAIAKAVPQLSGANGSSKQRTVHWNVLQVAPSGIAVQSPELDMGAWHIRLRYHRTACCMRAMAAMAAASRKEDRWGVLQLSDVHLADVVAEMLSVTLVLQLFTKYLCSINAKRPTSRWWLPSPPWLRSGSELPSGVGSQHVDYAACALEDVARRCVYAITLTFGSELTRVVKERVAMPPPAGTLTDLLTLLESFLSFKE